MPIAFYMDHHVPGAITLGLRLRGVEVLTAYEDGMEPVSWMMRPYWTDLANWHGFFSHEMMICYVKQRNDNEKVSPSTGPFTPTNSGFRLGGAYKIWKLFGNYWQ